MTEINLSKITDYLFISDYPRGGHYPNLVDLNIRLVLSMYWMPVNRVFTKPPMRLLWLPTFDHPWLPIPISILKSGVHQAIPVIRSGYAVLCHCRQGRHRSVAMAGCILVSQGYSADEAARLIKERRPVADPYAEYILDRIKKFEQTWRSDHARQASH
jgi:protein-tyrosine phosphatase